MANRYDFDIPIPMTGFTWTLKGYIDRSSQEIDATLSVMVPFVGVYQLTKVKGNLKDGVGVSFEIHNLRGEAKFYILDGWLWWHLSKSTVFGLSLGPLDIKLIPLPVSVQAPAPAVSGRCGGRKKGEKAIAKL